MIRHLHIVCAKDNGHRHGRMVKKLMQPPGSSISANPQAFREYEWM